jgi:hypothetical protein
MKNYIGGKQARPDGGYSYSIIGKGGAVIGQAGIGNRKDIRNAVEEASKASSWGAATAHNRAQVLYYLGENSMRAVRISWRGSSKAPASTRKKRKRNLKPHCAASSIMPRRPTSSTVRFIPPSRAM